MVVQKRFRRGKESASLSSCDQQNASIVSVGIHKYRGENCRYEMENKLNQFIIRASSASYFFLKYFFLDEIIDIPNGGVF
jgi:hypothetical protein